MAVRGTKVGKAFDELKAKNPKMSDTEAMQRAIGLSSQAVSKGRAKSKTRHSPAGQRYLRSIKRKKKR